METHDTHDGTVLAPARTCGRRVLFSTMQLACALLHAGGSVGGRRSVEGGCSLPLPTPRLITANLDAVGVLTHCDLFVCCESGC